MRREYFLLDYIGHSLRQLIQASQKRTKRQIRWYSSILCHTFPSSERIALYPIYPFQYPSYLHIPYADYFGLYFWVLRVSPLGEAAYGSETRSVDQGSGVWRQGNHQKIPGQTKRNSLDLFRRRVPIGQP